MLAGEYRRPSSWSHAGDEGLRILDDNLTCLLTIVCRINPQIRLVCSLNLWHICLNKYIRLIVIKHLILLWSSVYFKGLTIANLKTFQINLGMHLQVLIQQAWVMKGLLYWFNIPFCSGSVSRRLRDIAHFRVEEKEIKGYSKMAASPTNQNWLQMAAHIWRLPFWKAFSTNESCSFKCKWQPPMEAAIFEAELCSE